MSPGTEAPGGAERPLGPWRLLVTEPLDGPTNMAMDEALLRSRIAGWGPPTVRFYAWAPPTLSLGYAQRMDASIAWEWCRRRGIGVVRRPTGGSAILHEGPAGELTYSVVARAADFAGAGDVLETYRVIGTGLAAGLGRLGLAAELVPLVRARRPADASACCFARAAAYEIAVGGRKLVGSAQRRQAGAFLQHGSILLDGDPARIRAAFPGEPDPAAGLTSVAAALGRRVEADELVALLARHLGDALGRELRPDGLAAAELTLVERLVHAKYGDPGWTRDGVAESPAAPAPARSGG